MQTLRKVLKRKTALIGAVILLIFFLTALVGPFLCAYDPLATNPVRKYEQPSAAHILGTDYLGRDVFTRMVYGARVSLSISFLGVLSGALVGIVLGLLAGYYGKWIDTLISRFLDVLLAFPGLLLAIMIVAMLGKGIENTIIAVAVFSVPSIARLIRGITISLRESEYLQACRAMGATDFRIIFFHILPNTVSQIIVSVTLNLGTAILTASSLSFLGLGVQPPSPEWGAMLSSAREVIRTYPMASIVPGVMITLVVLSFSMFGDGLRDALDPKLQYRFRGNT
ncbi:MAG TPA: ABC transporter permease [Candidatus Limnocylindria bacterium]|nr:ABC transporter permease [Candidatus Limnocylindria bacterium]